METKQQQITVQKTLCTLRVQEKWQDILSTVENLSQNLCAVNVYHAAEAAYALARLQHNDKAEKVALQVLQAIPSVLAARALVLVYLQTERTAAALKLAQSVFSPPFAFTDAQEAAQAIVVLASVHKNLNETDKVRSLLAESRRIFPLATACFLLATVELNLGNFEQGIEALQAGLTLKADSLQWWYILADTFHKLNRISDMIQVYESALVYHPQDSGLLSNLGEWYTRLHRYADAEKMLLRAIEMNQEYGLAWVNLGKLLYLQSSREEECGNAFKRAIQLMPQSAELMFNLAQVYFKIKDKREDAFKLMREAYRLNPQNSAIAMTLAEACTYSDLHGEADEIIRTVTENNPDDPFVLFSLSRIASLRADFDKSLAYVLLALDRELWFLKQQSSLSLFGDGAHPPMDVYDASETLIAVCKFLEKLKVPYFLFAGTLLGIIRDGELLPHDKDADLGIGWDVDREWLITQFEESEELDINGARPEAETAQWNFAVVRKGTLIGVDFFFQKPDGDHWLTGFDAAPTPWLQRFKQRPLTTVNYKGHLLPIPENPEGYLEEVYGPDWRIPMTSYDTLIAAENLCPEAYLTAKIIGYNRLYEALMKRSWKKVLWYCEALKRFDNPPILDELANWLRGAMPPAPPKN